MMLGFMPRDLGLGWGLLLDPGLIWLLDYILLAMSP